MLIVLYLRSGKTYYIANLITSSVNGGFTNKLTYSLFLSLSSKYGIIVSAVLLIFESCGMNAA